MSERVCWRSGTPALQRVVDDALAGTLTGRIEALRDNARRRVLAVHADGGPRLVVKHFRTLSGRHPVRERVKAALGLSGARREWRALRALRAAGVAVPEPLAFGTLPSGDPILVTRYVDGPPLAEARRAEPGRRTWEAVGGLIRDLHRAGFAHNDLHAENLLLSDGGPALVDLQHARRTRSWRARRKDLGRLEFGLRAVASTPQRVRVAATALGLARPFGSAARRRLRAVARAALQRADAH
ncbi:MAG: phosphotransferase, partial [Deltaproteobacteria bacterium]